MPRLVFEKTGNGIYISHLDLMRLFQRAFKRAGLPLKHSQGYNPRPMVSIALPLSVGVESHCELLDFELDGADVPCNEIKDRLNDVLVSGVRVLDCLPTGRKLKELCYLSCTLTLEYDQGIPAGAADAIGKLLTSPSVIVPKKSKSYGFQDQDLIPLIRSLGINGTSDNTLELQAVICCQNPALNPMQIPLAIQMYLPAYKPDFVRYCRTELYDNALTIFR